jgi:hypothetical protein
MAPAPITPTLHGLRSHDVHQGLHGARIDRDTGTIARDLEATQRTGRAAALAAWIKGQDVIEDAQQLKVFAGQQLDIGWDAFDRVVELLDELGFVSRVQRSGHKITGFYEYVPSEHAAMYESLGAAWQDHGPSEIESSLLDVVDDLSRGPRLVEDLQVDATARSAVLAIGSEAEAIRVISIAGSEVAYSPFFAFERPDAVREALESASIDRIREAFEVVRSYQGTPVSISPASQVLAGLVGTGLMAGPALERPDGTDELFAVAPYGVSADLRGVKKPVLDKALAIVASVRMGHHFGGATALRDPVALLRKLEDGRPIAPHSSHARQYSALHKMGIVVMRPSGSWQRIELLDDKHGDNRAAVRLAIELIQIGEAGASKEYHASDEASLLVDGTYRTPIQAVRPARSGPKIRPDELRNIIEAAMGRRPID